MNHKEYINDLIAPNKLDEGEYNIISSLIYTLKPKEACELFDFTFQQNYRIRRYILKKISVDMMKIFLDVHNKFLNKLLEKLDEKKFGRKESCASSLDFLFASLPPEKKTFLLEKMLSSASSRNRDRGYKRIRTEWDKKHIKKVESNWNEYHDLLCLRIILGNFPVNYLIENYKELMRYCEAYEQAKLFIRIGSEKPKLLVELKESDEISYAYVLTKFNKKLTKKEASSFLRNNFEDKRIGLLLWSFGQMGLWDNIVEYKEKYKEKHQRALINQLVIG